MIENKLIQVSWTHKLSETMADSLYKANPERWNEYPGSVRWENGHPAGVYKGVYCIGPCWFVWACNRSGATQSQGALATWYTRSVDDITSGSTSTVGKTAVAAVADEEVGNYLVIEDNNDAAGGAPEGEAGLIVKNTTALINVVTNAANGLFTVAPAADDDIEAVQELLEGK